jgi:hypothetical protein
VIQLARLGGGVRLPFSRQAIGGVTRGSQHVANAIGESLPRVRDAAGHWQCQQIVKRVGNLFIDGSLTVLILALDGERFL